MKRILCVLIAILMMLSLTVPAFAASDVKYITNTDELVDLLINGGKGKFTYDITFTSDSFAKVIREGKEKIDSKVEIDLNGKTLFYKTASRSLTFKDVVWCFKNGSIEMRGDSFTGNTIELIDSIILLDGVSARFTSIFSDKSNITLFLINQSDFTASNTKAFTFCYRTSLTGIPKMNSTPMLINLDGGTINLESFKNVTFKDGYAELNSIIPKKDNEEFVRWSNNRADWTTNFTITFDPGEGTCDTKTLTTLDNGKLDVKQLPIVTKDGYCFVGWFEDGSSEKVTIDTVFTKSTKLHAKLVAKEEQIKNIEKPMKDLGFGEADVQKVISLFSSNKVAGSVIASEPVWGIAIAALVVGAFAGGTVFGRKNKKD